ncbi:hypothetical protein [Brevibacillus panacihumi]|uniref:hypothetical protein n=1 Tax=Brevibacillus panacihumi TaxID=497735 RepID=UPI003CCC826F
MTIIAKGTILVADEDTHIRELLRFYLKKKGYQILAAADGEEAGRRDQCHRVIAGSPSRGQPVTRLFS